MKKIIITFMLCSFVSAQVYGAIGCMDDSYHLQKSNDHKTRHFVHCTCPCSQYKIVSADSKCLVCFHYHQPKKWMVISGTKEIMSTEQYVSANTADEHQPIPKATQKALHNMISQYKKIKAYREKSI